MGAHEEFSQADTQPYDDDEVPETDEKVPPTCDDAIDPPVSKKPEDIASEKRKEKRARDDGDTPKNTKRKTPSDTAYPCRGKQSGSPRSEMECPASCPGSPAYIYFPLNATLQTQCDGPF